MEVGEKHVLISLLSKLMLHEKNGIAVAVNAEVISKKQWDAFKLNDNDEVIIFQAAQGG